MVSFINSIAWGNVAQWGALIIACLTFYFGPLKSLRKKVSDVEKIVDELKEQKEIFAADHELNRKRFELETRIPILETRPLFKKELQRAVSGQNQIQLILVNEGLKADEVKIENGEPIGATWNISRHPINQVPKGGKIDIMINSGDPTFEGIEFDLTYYAEDDTKYVQHIAKKFGGNIQIEIPK